MLPMAMRFCVAAGLLLVLTATNTLAQTLPSDCGGMLTITADAYLPEYLGVFTDSDYASWRNETGISELPPSVAKTVVQDSRTCRTIMRSATRDLNGMFEDRVDDAYDFYIFQYGSYYAILFVHKPFSNPSIEINTMDIMLFYDANSLTHLGDLVMT